MTKARLVRPTDLAALVSFDGRVYPNQAVTWDRLGKDGPGPHPLESALEQWFSFATGRHTWISIQGQTIKGLTSARQRSVRTAWEVECLIAASDDTSVALNLLDQLSRGAGEAGVEKIFLRLAADSELLTIARSGGFIPYVTETLWTLRREDQATGTRPVPSALPLRPRQKADLYPLYQLYNAAVPEKVRRVEAPTFREWRASREAKGKRRQREWVMEQADGRIAAWLRAVNDGELGRFDLLVHHQSLSVLDELVQAAISFQSGSRTIACLVPEYQEALARRLCEQGFVEGGKYLVLAKRLLRPATAARPVFKTATRAIGVF